MVSGQLQIAAPCLREYSQGPHWVTGWINLRGGLEISNKNNISLPCRVSEPD